MEAVRLQALDRLLGSPLPLTGPDATHQTVAAARSCCRIAHFACHGLSDWANSAASRLLLHDHASAPLTVTGLGATWDEIRRWLLPGLDAGAERRPAG